jgi:hypothetical protein
MGFKVKAAIKESIYHGVGLHALEFIPAGKVISTMET